MKPIRNKHGEFIFKNHPDFLPNLSPQEMFELGSFGGTYWRPIKSKITGESYKDVYLQYPDSWWKNIDVKKQLTLPWSQYDKSSNKYGVKVGQTLESWEEKEWITTCHPYGWVHWYCDFFLGKRHDEEDLRQIKRWKGVSSKQGRFRKWLVTLIIKKNAAYDDVKISPKIRQTLQHWGYHLTLRDYKQEVESRNIKK